jgi:hypothetical protein
VIKPIFVIQPFSIQQRTIYPPPADIDASRPERFKLRDVRLAVSIQYDYKAHRHHDSLTDSLRPHLFR